MTSSSLIALKTRRSVCILMSSFFVMLLAATDARSQTVVSRTRIGGYSEDITYVSRGRLRNNIVILDGYEVFAVENLRTPKGQMTKLFDVKIPEINTRPNGITYIESEGLFAFNEVTQPTKLFLFTDTGQFKGTRTIGYLGGYVPQHMEGLAYIPSTSPSFPDHIIVTALDTLNGPSRIEVVRRDGHVDAEIFPNWPAPPPSDPDNPIYDTSFIGDVAFLAPNKLLVTFYTNAIWTIDFAGNVLAGPHEVSGANGFEGIVQMSDNRIVAVNYPQSLMFFDQNLNRAPESDRNDLIGLNLNTPRGVAWNSDTDRLLITHGLAPDGISAAIASVPISLDAATQVVDLTGTGFGTGQRLTYLPAEHLIAVASSIPRAILLFNSNGTLNSQINLSMAALGLNLGNPLAITYIPATDQFVVGFNGINNNPDQPAERRRLRVFSRTGTLVNTLDLTPTGTAGIAGVAYFQDSGGAGRFMILGSAGRAFITDLNGDSRIGIGLFGEFNIRVKLGLLGRSDITAITTGPQAGAFAVVDNAGGEIVIFRLD
ncbi:MAG: hypothetical protein AABO41_11810 [Acidobacteriota bacterium]